MFILSAPGERFTAEPVALVEVKLINSLEHHNLGLEIEGHQKVLKKSVADIDLKFLFVVPGVG